MSLERTIGGKKYRSLWSFGTKEVAERTALGIRMNGTPARVLSHKAGNRSGKTFWDVYVLVGATVPRLSR